MRDITSGFQTEIEAQSLSPILLFKAEFDSGDVRFWTGLGDLTFDSETYTGSGDLIKINQVSETQELRANNVTFELSGIPASLVSAVLTEGYKGGAVTAWFGVLDDTGALIADPYQIFSGIMDVIEIEDDGDTAKILVQAESELIDLRKSRVRRYTPEDQKLTYPNDKGLDFVPTLQDKEITWGANVQ